MIKTIHIKKHTLNMYIYIHQGIPVYHQTLNRTTTFSIALELPCLVQELHHQGTTAVGFRQQHSGRHQGFFKLLSGTFHQLFGMNHGMNELGTLMGLQKIIKNYICICIILNNMIMNNIVNIKNVLKITKYYS